ncbi:hypothetical protein CCAX7_53750 [Capsulimonas corticalis]|uniref:Uncharacterized protein n=1 Tax=Capsulimonas corticalis TaxID=2219043 RepID=A0A402CNU1_9BACT|nr:hypothetical protein [Capsulimonas corticalis]BDI33324.1 hypothetical protein CCAX7_53750 [Capsulimonas corticalis]
MPGLPFNTITDAVTALQKRQVPISQIPQTRQFIQDRYDQLRQQGFWEQPQNTSFGHSLRQQGLVNDPTQGQAPKRIQTGVDQDDEPTY